MTRIVGLSRHQDVQGLLRQVGNMPRPTRKDPPADHDSPLSTEDEDDAEPARNSRCEGSPPSPHRDILHSSGSSDTGRPARGNIRQTQFGKSGPARTRRRATRTTADACASLVSGTKAADDDGASSSKRRRVADRPPSSDGQTEAASALQSISNNHSKDESLQFAKKNKPRNTYGSKNRPKSERLPGAAPARHTKASLRKSDDAEPRLPTKLKLPASVPEKEAGSGTRQGELSSNGPLAKLQVRRYKGDAVLDDESDSTEAKLNTPSSLKSPQAATDKDGHFAAHVSDVASAQASGSSSDSEVVDSDAEAAAAATVCPWCGQPVEKSLLDEFSRGNRMNVKQQTRFCQNHRKQTAMETWQARKYPEVNWHSLHKRFATHRGFLLGIVKGKPSHFRAVLAHKIESGQARSMKKEGNMSPGYYGPRGFDLMCDYLVDEFGELLKEKAVDDRVIAGRGPAAFIQTVLVAELAVRLIKDDMGVSTEEARDIMEESKALGELVHEGP